MELFFLYLFFVLGLLLIIKGGDFFVDAAVWLAEITHVPQFVIGATVVSVATTLPELFVSSIAALQGKTDMAAGNAVGSVIANTGLIFSLGILFIPAFIRRRRLLPKGMLFLSSITLLWLFTLSGKITLFGCAGMFLLFAVFIAENIREAKAEMRCVPPPSGGAVPTDRRACMAHMVKFVLGAAGILLGSQLLVDNGSLIAESFGISERIISLTAVAIGTSLPELVTTVTAVVKKQASLSVGNIIGANIIDVALILPVCAFLSGGALPVGVQTYRVDLPVCLLIASVMIVPALFKGRFMRWQGVLMLFCYGVYLLAVCNL